jgi:hypothetical protein
MSQYSSTLFNSNQCHLKGTVKFKYMYIYIYMFPVENFKKSYVLSLFRPISMMPKRTVWGAWAHCSECPICFELSRPPIYQCPEGHIICSDCRYISLNFTSVQYCRIKEQLGGYTVVRIGRCPVPKLSADCNCNHQLYPWLCCGPP